MLMFKYLNTVQTMSKWEFLAAPLPRNSLFTKLHRMQHSLNNVATAVDE